MPNANSKQNKQNEWPKASEQAHSALTIDVFVVRFLLKILFIFNY